MSDESSSGGRSPSSIKPPTIKPPTGQGEDWGAPSNAPPPSFGAMPQPSASAPLAASGPPRRQRNVGLWIAVGFWLFFILIFALGVVVYLSLR